MMTAKMMTAKWTFAIPVVIGCIITGLSGSVLADLELHVVADASDNGDGTQAKPFQSLTQARDAVRAARKAGTLKKGDAVTVHIAPGTYRFEKSFELTEADSGTASAPVIYKAERSGTVHLIGGIPLESSDFRPLADDKMRSRLNASVRNKVLVADLSKQIPGKIDSLKTAYRGVPVGPWLYVKGQPQTIARWPNVDAENSGWATFSKATDTGLPNPKAKDPAKHKLHPGAFVFEDPRPARWNLDEGVWLEGYWTHDWSDEVIRIASYDPATKVITLAAPHHYGIMAGTWGASKRRFYAMNLFEELDAPGEWYLDRHDKKLYYYPDGKLKDASIVLATLTQPIIRASAAKHVKLIGLNLGYSHGEGISLKNTEDFEIAGCVLANLAKTGVSVNGRRNTIRSCDIYNIGTVGISLNGGDRKSLTLAENLSVNNHIHHFGIFQRTYAPGIAVRGCGQIIRNNSIHDAPHTAVLYGGNEHLFELNDVYRVVMETGDAGAFYTGRDWTSQGNVLRHNFIHDLGSGDSHHVNTMGVYLDDCDSGDTVEGNFFYRAGRAIMIGGGRDNPILNNLVIDCPIGLHVDSRGMTWKQWNDPSGSWYLEGKANALNYKESPWKDRYPNLARIMDDSPREPLHNPIQRNIFVNCSQKVWNYDANVKKLFNKFPLKDNLAVNTTGAQKGIATAKDLPGFKDLTGTATRPIPIEYNGESLKKFGARENARLRKILPSFQPIPFDRIGLMKDEYRLQIDSQK